jgi:hypothetical protein
VHALASLVFAVAGFGIQVGENRILPIGYAPAWSPSGERIAFVTRGDLWVADADGSHAAFLVHEADTPAWAPTGRRLAFVRDGYVWTVRADGLDERRLARGAHPAWSPLGKRIALDRGGVVVTLRWDGGDPRVVANGAEPTYAPDGRIAYVRDGSIFVGPKRVADGDQPVFAPDGRTLAWVRDGHVYVAGRPVAAGTQPDWRPAVRARELLPDLEQRPPSDLTIQKHKDRWLLGFTSKVYNVGLGPAYIVGTRTPDQPRMKAVQRVLLSNGRWRTYSDVASLRYTNSPPHHHWHLMRYDGYELRSLDGTTLIRDRKSGFCLADHYGIVPRSSPQPRPFFLGRCQQFNPKALKVVEGTSVGYMDRYPAFFHGQNDDITNVPAGVYDLVHRVNGNLGLEELRYENDAASVRLRLTWRRGVPSVKVLRHCPGTAVC